MVYRKGELSKGTMDRQWPHQVALSAFLLHRPQLRDHPPLLRGSVAVPAPFFRARHDILVFCFAERAHAEQFRDRFGGEFIDPKYPAEVAGHEAI